MGVLAASWTCKCACGIEGTDDELLEDCQQAPERQANRCRVIEAQEAQEAKKDKTDSVAEEGTRDSSKGIDDCGLE